MQFFITILPFLFMVLAGIASSCMDMNAFHKRNPHSVLFTYYLGRGGRYYEWWIGGNEKFPPENPFTADFWHFAKWVQNLSTTGAILSALLVGHLYPSPWLALYVLSYGVFGLTFVLFYHYVWRDNVPFSRLIKFIFKQDKI